MQRRRLAYRRHPKETYLAVLTQTIKSWHDLLKDLPNSKRRFVFCRSNRIVQMKNVDVIELQSCQATLERGRDGVRNSVALAGRQSDFGTNHHIRGLEGPQNAAEVPLGFTIAVLHCRVEIVDPGCEGSRNGAFLIARVSPHHQSTDCAAAEAQHRDLHACASEAAQLHRYSSMGRTVLTASRVRKSGVEWVSGRRL